ncbi:hypothetical protein SAMN05660199_03852 [Klenkia soli]|uniref:Amidohydrolase family protein n=1 Tax=Klenkia soli TaxID=1052260 RepID=A0A1H0SIK4_9ACTN|nr:hypothetical protein [Klenkia soli]SDP41547.1 hypothetical protein SAMN05660199_03852 [Klenkia soli]
MTDLLLADVRPWGGPPVDLLVTGDRITDVVPAGSGSDGGRVEGGGLLALPGGRVVVRDGELLV